MVEFAKKEAMKADDVIDADEGVTETFRMMNAGLLTTIGIGIGLAFATNVLHLLYCTFVPLIYIKGGFLIGIVLAALMSLVIVLIGYLSALVFPGIWLLLSLLLFCLCKRLFPLNAALLGLSCC